MIPADITTARRIDMPLLARTHRCRRTSASNGSGAESIPL
jgi:hypothetical protein